MEESKVPESLKTMEEKIEAIKTALHSTYNESDNKKRLDSEQFVKYFLANDAQAFEVLVSLIIVESSPSIKQAAVIWITKIMEDLLKVQVISPEMKMYRITLLIKAMMSQNLQYELRKLLNHGIRIILRSDISEDIRGLLMKAMNEILDKDEPVFSRVGPLLGALNLAQLLVETCLNREKLTFLFNAIDRKMMVLCGLFFESLAEDQKKLVLAEPNQAQYPQEYQALINQCIEKVLIIEAVCSVELLFTARIMEFKDPKMFLLILNPDMINLIQRCLALVFSSSTQPESCFLHLHPSQLLNKPLNNLKTKAMLTADRLLKLIEYIPVDVASSGFFVPAMSIILQSTLKSLLAITREPVLERILNKIREFQLGEVITYSMSFISHACTYFKEFFDVISNAREPIIALIVAPLIATTPEEYQNFENQPREFFLFNLDTAEVHRSKVIKTEAAKLLESLCSYLDGATSMLGNYSINLLAYTLSGKESLSANFTLFPALGSYIENCVILAPPQVRFDIALMMLTCYADKIGQRPDIIKSLEAVLSLNLETLGSMNDFLKSKLCIFFSFFYKYLFRDSLSFSHFVHFFSFVFNACEEKPERSNSLNVVAIESLQAIFEDEGLDQRFAVYIRSILSGITIGLKSSTKSMFFELVSTVLIRFDSEIASDPKIFEECLVAIVQRLKSELSVEKPMPLVPEKLFNALRFICENQIYVEKCREIIENQVKPLYEILDDPAKCANYDEDLFMMASSLAKNSKALTETSYLVLRHVVPCLERYKFALGFMYEMINTFCFYGKDVLSSKPDVLRMFIKVACSALNSFERRENLEAFQSEGALLLQSIIENFISVMTVEDLKQVYGECLVRLLNQSTPVKNGFLVARILEVFLIGFLFSFGPTKAILTEANQLRPVMELILTNRNKFTEHYERKLSSLAMSNILFCNDGTFNEMLPHIIEFVSIMLKAQEIKDDYDRLIERGNQAAKEQKKKEADTLGKLYINLTHGAEGEAAEHKCRKGMTGTEIEEDDDIGDEIDADEDEFSDEDDENTLNTSATEESAAKLSLGSYITGINKQDEFDAFRKVIRKIHAEQGPLLNMSVENLTPQVRQYFNEIIHKQRIVTAGAQNALPRKILTVKRPTK